MADFHVGDSVWLKTGSPELKVVGVNQTSVVCSWTDAEGEHTEKFPFGVVTKEPVPMPPVERFFTGLPGDAPPAADAPPGGFAHD